MRLTGLAATTCLVIYVSGAAVFRYAPNRKRQGQFLDGIGLADSGTTRTLGNLPTTISTTILIPHDATTTTKALLPNLGDILFPLADPTTTTTTSSSASSTALSTSSPTPTRTHTSSSSPSSSSSSSFSSPSATKLAIPSGTLTVLPSNGPAPEMTVTSWKPTVSVSPSSTSSAVPASAASASSTWKIVGIAVSVITLIALTILLVVFYEQWTAFLRDVFLCRRSSRDQDPLGDEEFLPDKHHENYDTGIRSYNRNWAREIRESARLSNIRYPTDVFYGDGSTLGPGKAGIGAGGGAGRRAAGVGEFGQFDRPPRPSFLQRLSMISLRSASPVSPRLRMNGHSPSIGNTDDTSALTPPKMTTL